MNNKMKHITKTGLLLGLAAIVGTVQTVSAAAHTPPGQSKHGGGPPGGGPTNVFYPTVTNNTQLIGDINYANQFGGTYTIYLQPNTTFTGGWGIGGSKTVNLTIIGNGDTIDGGHQNRMFVVASGSSLTLDQVTLQNGYVYAGYGGAIYNSGRLTISNSILSGNTSLDRSDYLSALRGVGGAIYNNGGTVIIESSILSDNLSTGANPMGGAIYNASGMVTISNSTFTNNSAVDTVLGINVDPEYPQSGEGGAICNDGGTVTISHSSLTSNYAAFEGGGLCNGGIYNSGGTATVENSSHITGNTASAGGDVDNFGTLYLDNTSEIDLLEGNSAIPL